jgi:glycosyltransferase involved in cell wall biosynthesis
MAAVVARHPRVHVVLAGNGCGPSDEPIRALVAAAGLEGLVHLLGPRLDIERVTAALDVAVSASRYGESFPNAVVEALACEVPVVATDVGAARELVGEAGRVVATGSADALVSAVCELLELDAYERRALGRAGRASLERFGGDQVAARYLELYRTVADP